MRLLEDDQRKPILDEVCEYANTKTNFQLPDCQLHVRVIPGEVEGLYGWLAANYLLGGFHAPKDHAHGRDHNTFGFLDMGGASAQIAFAPNATEAERHADDLKLLRLRTVDGTPAEYRIFTTTWLGFGVNEARRRYVEALQKDSGSVDTKVLEDPCLPPGLSTSTKGDVFLEGSKTVNGKTPTLKGTGEFDKCLTKTLPLLEKDHICEDDPCLLGGVHVPAIDFDVNHFVGVSEYWHTTHDIFQIGEKDKAYDFNTYQQRVAKFCSQDWDEIKDGIGKEEWGPKVDEKIAVEVCFKASWLISVLHEGIGIPRVGLEETPDSKDNGTKKLLESAKEKGHLASFQAVNKIDDTEVSWTLGKMILYASAQIPSSGSDLPVGFGSNSLGVPSDFQYPSIQSSPQSLNHKNGTTSEEDTWPSSLLHPNTSRRIPGILLFLSILCLAIYLLRGRGRRLTLHPSPPPHNNRSFFSTNPLPSIFRSSPRQSAYERVLEDGSAADDFELGDVEEDNSDSSTGSRASGRATPRTIGGAANGSQAGGFETLGAGLGLGVPNAMGRSGLVGRTESRERIVGMAEGRRSRRGSPKRPPALGKVSED